MRQVTSRGSAKAFYLDREQVIARLRRCAGDALRAFPEVTEILLFGSLALGTHTGLSDVDLAVVLDDDSAGGDDPLERARPFYAHFFRCLGMGVDVITLRQSERAGVAALLDGAVVLARRGAAA